MDAIAVIAAGVERQILQHRAQPDGAGSEALDVAELLLDTGETAALILGVIRVIEGLMDGRRRGIVESVHHEEVDHLVSPVGRRWERGARFAPGRPARSRTAWTSGEKRDVNIMSLLSSFSLASRLRGLAAGPIMTTDASLSMKPQQSLLHFKLMSKVYQTSNESRIIDRKGADHRGRPGQHRSREVRHIGHPAGPRERTNRAVPRRWRAQTWVHRCGPRWPPPSSPGPSVIYSPTGPISRK